MSIYLFRRTNINGGGMVKAKGHNHTMMGGFNRLYASIMHILPHKIPKPYRQHKKVR